MLPCYVMLDLETTGGSGTRDRITEIAAVRVEGGLEVARWSSLVNPETPIPYFIETLTGINDAMVADAPCFKDLADPVLAMLDGAVLCAHNAGFDHGFLRGEFARLGHDLRIPTLCTVRLSRQLYPQFKSHGLDALIQRHHLHTEARHRAMGDVDMVLAWLAQAQAELGQEQVQAAAQALLQPPSGLPVQLETDITDVPDSPGVYLLYGDSAAFKTAAPLFVGSAAYLRQRVTAQLQSAAKSARDRGIANNTRRVEWRQTAGEVGAVLLAKRLTQDLKPLYSPGKPPVAIDRRALHPWPHTGPLGLREHDVETGRSDLHVFNAWCHVATLHDDDDLAAWRDTHARPNPCQGFEGVDLPLDMDIYRLLANRLIMRLKTPGQAPYPGSGPASWVKF